MNISDNLLKKYPKSVPILLNPCDKLHTELKRKKFIVPKEYTFSRFISIVRSKCELDEKQGLFFFINGILPVMTDTIGQIYDRWTLDNKNALDKILVVDMRCENTFGNDNYIINVILDNRETNLTNLLKTKFPEVFNIVQIEQLSVGDIIIKSSNVNNGQETKIHYVFERKTMKDLRASIRDGRWKEQKERLTTWFPKEAIVYIIEDFEGFNKIESDSWTNVNEAAQISSILNTMFRDGIKIVYTNSLDDTARFINEFVTRCPNYINDQTMKYTDTIPTLEGLKSGATKKSKITKDNIFQLQLCQIPGVSSKISEALKIRYPKGFSDVFQEYNNIITTDKDNSRNNIFVQSLKDIPIKYDCNKRVTRKLGIRTAQNIVNHLLLC